ncbi:DNA repair protein RecN [Corynebacterium caspium]|uniref:DNA repair protein RecN n=1 Tax=Corynebacterium caspium TaxID=234828 RepID=UPI00039C9497|nr:DNA repair protein RecN [Corynebacterium caspium]WKD59351.1 DNA repair protein RecN [Corynebacterium caspium DSM 44850]
MLAEISIENLGIIPAATAELSPGLTVLTGETGAGKTMVVTGLRLLTGGRADASRIRRGASKAVVEGRFLTTGMNAEIAAAAQEIVENAGGHADENGEFIATRTISASGGRSRAHLGGRSVPAATLEEFSRELLTIHGQNDQLRLLGSAEQLAALDRYDAATKPLLDKYRQAYHSFKSLDKDLKQRIESRRELAQEIDRLEFAIGEISDVNPIPGEDVELVQLIRRLQDVDILREESASAITFIDGLSALGDYSEVDDNSASSLLGQAQAVLANSEDQELQEAAKRLAVLTGELTDISAQLGSFLSALPTDSQALEESLQRQQQLKTLTRKYAPDINGVLEWKKKAETRLRSIDISSEALEALQRDVEKARQKMKSAGMKLSALRRTAARKLSQEATAELRGLAMPKSRLVVEITETEFGAEGCDTVTLKLAPNETSEALPLATAASGGELSRVMLALEVILSGGNSGVTLVFDEVDAGVGGRAAVEIGRRLSKLATSNQVIAVTHLPQVAAYADTHLHVAKDVTDDSVTSGVLSLSKEERVEELARMLAGLDDTDTGRAHAAELLSRAQQEVAEYKRQ